MTGKPRIQRDFGLPGMARWRFAQLLTEQL